MRVHPGISLLNPTLEIVIPAQPCACDPVLSVPCPKQPPKSQEGSVAAARGFGDMPDRLV